MLLGSSDVTASKISIDIVAIAHLKEHIYGEVCCAPDQRELTDKINEIIDVVNNLVRAHSGVPLK